MALQEGDTLNNRYQIIHMIEETESVIFYRAVDVHLNLNVVLKGVKPEVTQYRDARLESAKVLSGLRHPNLMRITDQFESPEGVFYQVTDMGEGQPILDTFNFPQGLPIRAAMPVILAVCDALYYLHSNLPPIVHGQIELRSLHFSPRRQVILNLPGWITETNAVTDFLNLSTAADGDVLKDLYDLGLTTIELLSSQAVSNLFINETVEDLQDWFHQNIPGLPDNLTSVLTKVIHPNPNERYTQVDEFKTALLNALIFLPPEPAPELTVTRSVQFQIPADGNVEKELEEAPAPLAKPDPTPAPSTPIRRRVPWGLL